jgi:hypothetical protein
MVPTVPVRGHRLVCLYFWILGCAFLTGFQGSPIPEDPNSSKQENGNIIPILTFVPLEMASSTVDEMSDVQPMRMAVISRGDSREYGCVLHSHDYGTHGTHALRDLGPVAVIAFTVFGALSFILVLQLLGVTSN